jgi:hypothetical protein
MCYGEMPDAEESSSGLPRCPLKPVGDQMGHRVAGLGPGRLETKTTEDGEAAAGQLPSSRSSAGDVGIHLLAASTSRFICSTQFGITLR